MLDFPVNLDRVADELARTNALLLRLVQAIERVSPVLPSPDDQPPVYQATLDDLHTIDDEAAERAREGKEAIALRFGVVPDSPAFAVALAQYEEEMRRVYGKDTVVDWEKIFEEAGQADSASRRD